MGKVLKIPFRSVQMRLVLAVWSFDGDVVSVRGKIGDLTIDAEVPADDWTDAGGALHDGAMLEAELV